MIPVPSNEVLNLIAVVLLLIIVGLFIRVEVGQHKAARIARDTASKAARAATDARAAVAVSTKILKSLESLGTLTRQATNRIEHEAGVVAADLQAQHDRADAVDSTEHGAAADAAATTAPKPT